MESTPTIPLVYQTTPSVFVYIDFFLPTAHLPSMVAYLRLPRLPEASCLLLRAFEKGETPPAVRQSYPLAISIIGFSL